MVSKIMNDWLEGAFAETADIKYEVRNKNSSISQRYKNDALQLPKPLFICFTKGIKLEPNFLPEILETIESKFRHTTSLEKYKSDKKKELKYSKETTDKKSACIEYCRKNIYLSRVMFNLFEMPDSSVSRSSLEYQNVVERNELYQKALQKRENFPQNFIEKSFQTDITDSKHKQVETIPMLIESKGCMANNYLMKKHFERSEKKIKPPPKTFQEFCNSKTKFPDYEELLKNMVTHPEISSRFKKALYILEKTLNYSSFKSSILKYNISMSKDYIISLSDENEKLLGENNSKCTEKIDIKSHLIFHLQNMENNYEVTCIECSSINPSIFVVGYGISKFKEIEHDPRGMLLCWNIHKCGYPEKIYYTEEIVTCLEFSKTEPYLVAVGMRYGLVAIFDLRKADCFSSVNNYSSKRKPLSTIRNIRWTKKKYETGKETEVLLSVSAEGLICCWSWDRILDGHIVRSIRRGTDTNDQQRLTVAVDASGMCMQMKPCSDNIFLIGTIEGQVLQADLNEPDTYGYVYNCHNGPVYSLQWSPLVSHVFMTCGTDRFIHVWQERKKNSSKSLVLDEVVLKIAWSHTKSTLFAAMCEKKTLFFDLTVDLHKEIAEFAAKKEVSFRYIAFCPKNNWVLVGQSDGITVLLELVDVPPLTMSQEKALKENFLSD